MPCGGHDLAANVWVEDGELFLYIDRSGNIDENDQQLKTGRLRISFSPNPFGNRSDEPAEFTQRLCLQTGSIQIAAATKEIAVKLRIVAEVFRPALHIEAESNCDCLMSVQYENWRTEKRLIPRTLNPDGTKSGWDFNRWSTYGYCWYEGEVFTYPDTVSIAKDLEAIEFFHENGEDRIFDKELALMRIDPDRHRVEHPTRGRRFGGLLTGPGLRAKSDVSRGTYAGVEFHGRTLQSEAPRRSHTASVYFHTSQGESLQQWRQCARSLISSAEERRNRIAETEAWWRDFWDRSKVVINAVRDETDEGWQIAKNYNLFRFMLALNYFGQWPTRFNGGLLTFDPIHVTLSNEPHDPIYYNPDFRAWGAWTAQNQRLLYWPMLKSGDFEGMRPQFEFYRRNLANARARTLASWNLRGASYCEQIGSGSLPLGSHYGWEPPYGDRDLDKEVGLSNTHATYYTTALEFAFMIHEWVRFSGRSPEPYVDFLKEVVVFHFEYFGMLEERRSGRRWDANGHLVMDPAHALESYHGRNPTDLICALRFNLDRLIALGEEWVTPEEREMFLEWRDRLPPINFRTRHGRKTIAPVVEPVDDPGNAEFPQLYPVFPWPVFGVGHPELQVAVDTWDYGHDQWKRNYVAEPGTYPVRDLYYGWHQQAIFLARLGLVEQAREYLIKKLADARGVNEFESAARMRFPAFWGPGFDWTPDHNWGGSGMIALQEMLLQTSDDRIFILPTWPRDWDVCFRLAAPKETTVQVEFQSGKIVRLSVQPAARAKDVVLPEDLSESYTANA